MEEAKKLALLLPLAAEHVFRTMGHHYLTNLSAEYQQKYERFFAACVLPTLTNYLPPEILYHRVAHWVSLTKALAVSKAPEQATKLPNAVVVRAVAGPAGTAIITTSEAIMKALAQTGLREALIEASGIDSDVIVAMSAKVKNNPGKYHTIPTAYNFPALSTTDKLELETAKEVAIQIAPILQGFLDSMPRNSDLPKARALIKHADTNPLLRKRAKVYFREVGVSKAGNMQELLSMNKREADATGGTGAVDPDEEDD
jgi:hypothetical protein